MPEPRQLSPDEVERLPRPDQRQWGRRVAIGQGAPRVRLVSVSTAMGDALAPLQGFEVTCSRDINAPLGVPQPIYTIVIGVGDQMWEWPNLAPGTYITRGQSIYVYADAPALGGITAHAWAGLTSAPATLVLP